MIDELVSNKKKCLLDRLIKIKEARLQYFSKSEEKEFSNKNNKFDMIINSPTKSQHRKNMRTVEISESEIEEIKKQKEEFSKSKKNQYKTSKIKNNTGFSKESLKSVSDPIYIIDEMLDNDQSINYDDSFFFETSSKKRNITEKNENVKKIKIIKILEKKIKITNLINFEKIPFRRNKLQHEKDSKFSLNYSINKDSISMKKIENKFGFVEEFKIISEFTKSSKTKFDDLLYNKVASSYCSEQTINNKEKSINVVDCLALDNLNRIYSKVYLPTINRTNIVLKRAIRNENDLITKNGHTFFNKFKFMNLVVDKSKSTRLNHNKLSIINLNSMSLNKDDSLKLNI